MDIKKNSKDDSTNKNDNLFYIKPNKASFIITLSPDLYRYVEIDAQDIKTDDQSWWCMILVVPNSDWKKSSSNKNCCTTETWWGNMLQWRWKIQKLRRLFRKNKFWEKYSVKFSICHTTNQWIQKLVIRQSHKKQQLPNVHLKKVFIAL